MERAFENRRYEDLVRWKLAETVLNRNIYGKLDVADLRTKVINQGLWFFPQTPRLMMTEQRTWNRFIQQD